MARAQALQCAELAAVCSKDFNGCGQPLRWVPFGNQESKPIVGNGSPPLHGSVFLLDGYRGCQAVHDTVHAYAACCAAAAQHLLEVEHIAHVWAEHVQGHCSLEKINACSLILHQPSALVQAILIANVVSLCCQYQNRSVP